MKFSLCNEVVRELDFAAQCDLAAALGYDALEIAPFTLCDDPRDLSAGQVRQIRRDAQAAGVVVSGLHWLLITPEGLSITAADEAVRARTLAVMRRCIELCAELGGEYLVHGSQDQRRLPDDSKEAVEAAKRGADAWAAIADEAEAAGVVYCIEALSPTIADFINTVEEAAAIIDAVDSPGLRTMIDCCAATNGDRPPAELIDLWLPTGRIAHIQANDTNLKAPGQGDLDFEPILAALLRHNYPGWLAVEPFVYEPDGPLCAEAAITYLKVLLDGFGQP